MKILVYILVILSLISCYDDKGNYSYKEMEEITFENLPEKLDLIAYADRIVIEPRIYSSVKGEILDGDPDYDITYNLGGTTYMWINGKAGQTYAKLNPTGSIYVDTLASFFAGGYICWITIEDIKNKIVHSHSFDIYLTNATRKGWLVLCDEDTKVRMDFVSEVSTDNFVRVYNLNESWRMDDIHNPHGIGFYPSSVRGDAMFVLADEGAFKLQVDTLTSQSSWNIHNINFITPPQDKTVIAYEPLYGSSTSYATATFLVTELGNAFALIDGGVYGSAFEKPINTSNRAGEVEFKVAPYIGITKARPENGSTALFYDIDNKRFVGWTYNQNVEDLNHILRPIQDPAGALFSFNTGMELIYMESTRFSGGVVYSVLEDASGNRKVYAINMSGSGFIQEGLYENLNAPEFNNARHFAFHSQYPLMFYSNGSNVYMHNLMTNSTTRLSLGLDSEEITMLKFNLYANPNLSSLGETDEFMDRQYELIIGSYNSTANNGGKLGYYTVNYTSNSVTKVREFYDFAKIVDVVYRERRN